MILLRRILYVLYRWMSSARYLGPRRFTRAGLAVLGGLVLSGMLSLNIAGSLSYQIFVVLLCLLATAAVGSRFYRIQIRAERRLPRLGTVGQPLAYTVVLLNRTSRPQADLTLLENLEDPRPRFEEYLTLQRAEEQRTRSFRVIRRARRRGFELARIPEAPVPVLLPDQPTEVRLEFIPLKRGCIRFAGVTVARPDPLGLVKGFADVPLPQSLLVLPRRYPLPPVALPGQRKYQQGGVALAATVGESDEFVALRDYRQGDPLRHIHWRSWAKAGKPIVKEFEDEFFVRHALILDTFTDQPQSEVFEEAVSVAASFVCTIQTQESLLDLLFVGAEAYRFTSGRNVAHTEQTLEVLASVRPCLEKKLDTLEHMVLGHLSVVSGCICVLIGWDPPRQRFVRRLRELGVPLLVMVITEARGARPTPAEPPQEEPGCLYVLEAGKVGEGLARLG